jgi:hypothetical protein
MGVDIYLDINYIIAYIANFMNSFTWIAFSSMKPLCLERSMKLSYNNST